MLLNANQVIPVTSLHYQIKLVNVPSSFKATVQAIFKQEFSMCAGVPRQCHSVTGEHGHCEQAPAVELPTSHFQQHFLCPPNPWCSKNTSCSSYKTNDSCFHSSLELEQHRCESTLAIDSWFWFHSRLVRNCLRDPTVQNNIAFPENT